jgi:hypothetical protein
MSLLSSQATPEPTAGFLAEIQIPYTRLTALLNLAGENPSTMEPLIHELRKTQFVVPVDGHEEGSLDQSAVFCNEREGRLFGIAFLRESDARQYFQDHTGPYQLMLCQGDHLLSTLVKRESPLGLYLVDGDHGYFLNADLMGIGSTILNFQDAEVEHIQYAPAPYSAVIPQQLRTELDLFCSRHPHIQRIYLSEILSERGAHGATFIIVGDHDASPVNVQDILSVIACRVGLADWKGTITWIDADDGEDILRRNKIDLVYSRKHAR